MHPLEALFAFLFLTDLVWGALVMIYLAIALPISYFIIKKRDKK